MIQAVSSLNRKDFLQFSVDFSDESLQWHTCQYPHIARHSSWHIAVLLIFAFAPTLYGLFHFLIFRNERSYKNIVEWVRFIGMFTVLHFLCFYLEDLVLGFFCLVSALLKPPKWLFQQKRLGTADIKYADIKYTIFIQV